MNQQAPRLVCMGVISIGMHLVHTFSHLPPLPSPSLGEKKKEVIMDKSPNQLRLNFIFQIASSRVKETQESLLEYFPVKR